MEPLGLIAGSAYRDLLSPEDAELERVSTEFGEALVWLSCSLAFLPRHGVENDIPPHRINHRANLMAFRKLGVSKIISVNSTGSLRKTFPPMTLLVPHDYANLWTVQTFYDHELRHITPGLDQALRDLILQVATQKGIEVVRGGVYVQTTGPRLETKAEIAMLRCFGDVVGMTMGNEATLARELDIAYASICSVDNFCHGITETPLREEDIVHAARENAYTITKWIHAILEELR